jgi:hypothetical protein
MNELEDMIRRIVREEEGLTGMGTTRHFPMVGDIWRAIVPGDRERRSWYFRILFTTKRGARRFYMAAKVDPDSWETYLDTSAHLFLFDGNRDEVDPTVGFRLTRCECPAEDAAAIGCK